MLDLFVIFSKGGIVLWCCEGTKDIILTSVNALIRSVILQERTSTTSTFPHGSLVLQYKLDNEFDLCFVVGYQKILKLLYVDKFLNDIHLQLRDSYKNQISNKSLHASGLDGFHLVYQRILANCEAWARQQESVPKAMKSFEDSKKSKKTVASLIVGNEKKEEKNADENDNGGFGSGMIKMIKSAKKMGPGKYEKKSPKPEKSKEKEKGKAPRQWDNGGTAADVKNLDRTKENEKSAMLENNFVPRMENIPSMAGALQPIQFNRQPEEKSTMLNMFKGLVGGKSITLEEIGPILEKLKDHLISKNVASEVAEKLCGSVATKLEGKVVGTFSSVTSTVRSALEESLLVLLQPKKQVDVLRDAYEAKRQGRPFIITFCGVNGVGKSTNLAKICYWLISNSFKVLVAACDTFRAGAVEQLRTHARHLNALHPTTGTPAVQLYEKGYGKDAAGVAAEAISFAKDNKLDVVLVDTAGRMQDNEPLMRALAKLIRVNNPDLILFVGEALVGNEAVDQLVKFNRAMADFSDEKEPRLIDGIVLTKFDTIDDKVGAAISMAWITGQPIVFVGTGQTYTDLKALDSQAVVGALMK